MEKGFRITGKTAVFLAPRRTLLGKDAIHETGEEIKMLGGSKALIVTDPGVAGTGLASSLGERLAMAGFGSEIYDKVIPEPPARLIEEAASKAGDGGCDAVIGLGGGSSLDVAKGVATVAVHGGHILDYVGVNGIPGRGLPLILIPTTAGTGSEASWVCVVTDEKENTKKSLYSSFLLPDAAILDPVATLSMPRQVTADTGFDALVHAIDSYISVNATPYTKVLSLQAISLIARNLPVAYAKGTNVEARYNMLLAANLAGMAFTSGGLGATHGLAYPLGTEFHMSHGRSNAVMLLHVMQFNRTGDLEAYRDIARAMGENVGGLDLYEAAERSIEAVKKLLQAVDIPYLLSDYGIAANHIPTLVEGGMKQSRFFAANPRNLTEDEVRDIYLNAL